MALPTNHSGVDQAVRERRPDTQTKSRWALVVTCVAAFMVTLDALVVITALPAIRQSIGASLDSLQWTINAYTLAFAAGIVTASTLGDRYGRRRMFAAGVVLFALSSAACALAPTADILIVARTIQGLAGAMVAPTALTILTSAFPAERRGAIVGVYGGVSGLAVASGPLVGGVLTQALSWHAVFWLNVPVGLVAAALALSCLDESYGPASPIDIPAVGLVSGGAVGIVLGLVRAADQGWASLETVVSLGLGILLTAGFIAWEMRAADPMLPMRMFRSATFSAANATAFFMTGSQFAAAFLIAQYFQLGQGHSPLDTGLRILPWTVTPVLVAPLAGVLSDRIGRRPLLLAGMVLQALGFILFDSIATSDAPYWQIILPLVVSGIGVSMVLPVAPAAVLSAVAPIDMGRASAVSNTLQRFGTAFGVAVATAVFIANGSLANPTTFSAGFRPALLAVAGMAVLGALTAVAVRKPQAAPTQAAAGPATAAILAA